MIKQRRIVATHNNVNMSVVFCQKKSPSLGRCFCNRFPPLINIPCNFYYKRWWWLAYDALEEPRSKKSREKIVGINHISGGFIISTAELFQTTHSRKICCSALRLPRCLSTHQVQSEVQRDNLMRQTEISLKSNKVPKPLM